MPASSPADANASLTTVMLGEPTKGGASEAIVARPAPGSVVVVDGASGAKLTFGFDLADCTVLALDVDIVLTFPDGAKIILPNLGMTAVGPKPPQLAFLAGEVDPQTLIGAISELHLAPIQSLIAPATGAAAQTDAQDAQSRSAGEGPGVDVGPAPLMRIARFAAPEEGAAPKLPEQIIKTALFEQQPIKQLDGGGSQGAPEAPVGRPGNDGVLRAKLAFDLFNTETSMMSPLPSGGFKFLGGTGGPTSSVASDYAGQSGSRRITGSSLADEIAIDSPTLAHVGSSSREFRGSVAVPSSGWVAAQATFKNLPLGFAVTNAVDRGDGTFTMMLDSLAKPNQISFLLSYQIPDDSVTPDANGFLSIFEISIEFLLRNSDNQTRTAAGTRLVGIRDVHGRADMDFVDPVTGEHVLVLWSNPPGSETDAGAGDDTVIAGAGADTIHGGAGVDTLSYRQSNSGVAVNLATGAASGGFARGDHFDGFENLIGSAKADSLTGDAGDNVIEGGGSADTMVGGGGRDTLDYRSSAQGVIVSLAWSGPQHGGDAEGDLATGFSAILGSATGANTLTGNAAANLLTGGAANDTLNGGASADTLTGGGGNDTADYADSTLGVTIDLNTATQSGGDAQGDVFNSIDSVIGSATGANHLIGTAGANSLTGGAASDTIEGGAGADTLVGGAGFDTVDYTGSIAGVSVDLRSAGAQSGGDAAGDVLSGFEVVLGSLTGANRLTGDALNNVLVGGNAEDTFVGGAGADTIMGGGGLNLVDYSASNAAVAVDLNSAAQQHGGEAEGDILANIKNVIGSAYGDTLRGTSGANSILGGGGDDTIVGLDGGDTLDGGAGSDVVDYSALGAIDRVVVLGPNGSATSSAGTDLLISIENLISGGGSDSIVTDSLSAHMIDGGAGDDSIRSGSLNDTLIGGEGADTLLGGAGSNLLLGGATTADYDMASAGAQDVIDYGWLTAAVAANGVNGGVRVTLGAGASTVDNGTGTDTISGFSGAFGSQFSDTLTGDAYANRIDGRGGDDTILAGAGADTVIGGAGVDLVSYASSAAGVTVDLTLSIAQSGGDAQGDILTEIENITGSAAASNRLTGDARANALTGGAAADTLIGGAGADTLTGGGGADIADYSTSALGVNVDLTIATAQSGGDAAGDVLSGIDNVTGSLLGANRIKGDSAANLLTGGGADDTLIGGGGADTLIGGNGLDTADYSASAVGVTVDLRLATSQSGGDAAGDTLSSIENVVGSATAANRLTGNTAANVLTGGGGDDTLAGGVGADTLIGGAGLDTADYGSSTAGVTVDLTLATSQAGGDAAGDVLSGVENVTGSSTAANWLKGDGLANVLTGGAGDDTFLGGIGADSMTGGGGVDVVDYSASAAGVTVNLASATGQSGGDAAGDVLAGIENVLGSAFSSNRLTGDGFSNALTGGVANDTLAGGGGADTLTGGGGIDLADYSASAAGVTVDLSLATSQSGGDAQGDILAGIANVTGSSTAANRLAGDAGANLLTGGAADDTFVGGLGADTMVGLGGAGDVVDYSAGGGVTVDLRNNFSGQTGGFAAGDILLGVEHVIGSATAANRLTGDDAANSLVGGSANDTLVGGLGADTLAAGGGSADLADYSASASGVMVDLTISSAQTGGDAGGDVLSGVEYVTGSTTGANRLTGDGAANSLVGGSADDTLSGGGGADTLVGGLGTDLADYASSTLGVTVDLSLATSQAGGDAAGDILSGIETSPARPPPQTA